MPARRELPEAAATRILRESGYEGKFPVDVYAIAQASGIRILERADLAPDLSGMLLREVDLQNPIIVLRKSDAKVRKRFTVAHEIGHEALHVGRRVLVEASAAHVRLNERRTGGEIPSPWEEAEANRFAAELLMPERLVSKLFDRYVMVSKGESSLISHLASDFVVSESAMHYRLLNLGLLYPPFGAEQE